MNDEEFDPRARTRELAAEFAARGDSVGWFEALYRESSGDNTLIPWADLEPNRFFRKWAEVNGLKGDGRTALVVGCGLGDDARYLHDLGFKVTAFDISRTAIEWAERLHAETDIEFIVADLFSPPAEWRASVRPPANAGGTDSVSNAADAGSGGFDFVLEIYTIQPLPLSLRNEVIDRVASFVANAGTLVVVTRGRKDDDEPEELPWPMSRRELSRFETHGLTQTDFTEMPGEENEPNRFVVEYKRK